jgi:hypothetical protein
MDLAVVKRIVFTDFGRSILKQQVIRIREEAGGACYAMNRNAVRPVLTGLMQVA